MLSAGLRRLLTLAAVLLVAACASSAKAPKPTPTPPAPLPGSPTKDALVAYVLKQHPDWTYDPNPDPHPGPPYSESTASVTPPNGHYDNNSVFDGVTIGYRTSTGIANGILCQSDSPALAWGKSAKIFDICLNAPVPGTAQFRAWYTRQTKIPLPSHPRPDVIVVTERSPSHPTWYIDWFSANSPVWGGVPSITVGLANTDDKASDGYSRLCFYPTATHYTPC